MKTFGIWICIGAILAAAIVLLSCVSVSAAASTAAGAPQPLSTNGVNLNLFVRGSDNNIYTKNTSDGSTWGTTASLGAPPGGAASDPSPVINLIGSVTVFVRGGADGALYSTTGYAETWSPWTQYGGGGVLKAGTGPSAINATTVFVTGTDKKLYEGTLNATTENFTWVSLGGVLTSSPGAVATSDGSTTVFVAGTAGHLWSITPGASYAYVGGVILPGTNPTAYSWSNGRVGLLVAGTDHNLYDRYWQGTTVLGWENLGGYLTTSPGSTARSVGNVDVFATGQTNPFTLTADIYQKSYSSASYGWGGWVDIARYE